VRIKNTSKGEQWIQMKGFKKTRGNWLGCTQSIVFNHNHSPLEVETDEIQMAERLRIQALDTKWDLYTGATNCSDSPFCETLLKEVKNPI